MPKIKEKSGFFLSVTINGVSYGLTKNNIWLKAVQTPFVFSPDQIADISSKIGEGKWEILPHTITPAKWTKTEGVIEMSEPTEFYPAAHLAI